MRLALDHHYSRAIAEQLRDKGHDAVAAIEQGWERETDEPLLMLCATEQRALVTNNVSDFTTIAQRWSMQGRSHYGLVFTSDVSLPRTRATIGRYVRLLHDLLTERPGPEPLIDRVHWL